MKPIYSSCNYTSSRLEKVFEKNLETKLLDKGIELVRVVKYGFDYEAPRYELQYDVYVKHLSQEDRCWMKFTFGVKYVESNDGVDKFTCSFVWYARSSEELKRYCLSILGNIGIDISTDLYIDTYSFLEKGISSGLLEELTL